MALFFSNLKSSIIKPFRKGHSENDTALRRAQVSRNKAEFAVLVRCKLASPSTILSEPARVWALDNIHDFTPFISLESTKAIWTAIQFSYDNCMFAKSHMLQRLESPLCYTKLDRIAKYRCCHKCESVRNAVQNKFPTSTTHSPGDFLIWCADWGDLKANDANKAAFDKAFQDGGVFCSIGGDEAALKSFQDDCISMSLSDKYWPFAKSMLSTCHQDHENCRATIERTTSYVPDRLISVGRNSTETKLIETKESMQDPKELSRYAALSYCWGSGGNNYETSRENLDEHKTRLPTEKLPNTIIDAINVCRNTDIPYLWVDALCIIQNDPQDWEEQTSKMREVYSNCIVALAIDDVADCGLGFLPRPIAKAPTKAQLIQSGDDSSDMPIRIWSWTENFNHQALSARGWALQERILPTRTLRFTSSSLIWECNQVIQAPHAGFEVDSVALTYRAMRLAISGRKDTLGPIPANSSTSTLVEQGKQEQDESQEHTTTFITSAPDKEKYNTWYSIAELYSSRTLTRPTDKLSAVSGLASLFANSLVAGPADYCAGLWRKDLVQGLLWHVREPCARHGTYVAPSWSWASMDGQISYLSQQGRMNFESHVAIEPVVCDTCTPVNPTGRVSGGYIQLTGQLEPVHLLTVIRSTTEALGHRASMYSGLNGQMGNAYKDTFVFVHPFDLERLDKWQLEALCDEQRQCTPIRNPENAHRDCDECDFGMTGKPKYFCLSMGRTVQPPSPVATDNEPERFRHWYLVLEAVPSPSPSLREDTYKRIGIGCYHRNRLDLFEQAEKRTIVII